MTIGLRHILVGAASVALMACSGPPDSNIEENQADLVTCQSVCVQWATLHPKMPRRCLRWEQKCHETPHTKQAGTVMNKPEVVVLFWGHDYIVHPELVSTTTQLFNDLVSGSFMNG